MPIYKKDRDLGKKSRKFDKQYIDFSVKYIAIGKIEKCVAIW